MPKKVRLADANINPTTGLATDYLNHFSEAVMLLDMLASCLEFWAEFLTVGYRQHFRASQFKARDLASQPTTLPIRTSAVTSTGWPSQCLSC